MILDDTRSGVMSDLNTDMQDPAARAWMAVWKEEGPVHSVRLGELEFQATW